MSEALFVCMVMSAATHQGGVFNELQPMRKIITCLAPGACPRNEGRAEATAFEMVARRNFVNLKYEL